MLLNKQNAEIQFMPFAAHVDYAIWLKAKEQNFIFVSIYMGELSQRVCGLEMNTHNFIVLRFHFS